MKTNAIIIFLLIGASAYGQTVSSYAILSAGNGFNQPGLIGNTSIGQSTTITLSSTSLIVTQGILQGELPEAITSIPNVIDITSEISVYPNPASEFINLNISNARNQTYHIDLFDMQGNILKNIEIEQDGSGSSKIDFWSYKSGFYILRIRSNDNKEQGFLKVLKND